MSKEQLAGLVEKWRGEAEEHTLLIAKAILRNKANELDAILATLPEPGVVTDEVARVAVNAYDRATGEGWQMPCVQGMRSALEAALPYLAPAARLGNKLGRDPQVPRHVYQRVDSHCGQVRMTRSTNMEHVEVLRELRDTGDVSDWRALESALDAAIAALSAPQSRDAESKLADAGVFAGHHGLRGLADAAEFWEKQPYGTRLYYGDGGMDYLHRGVLQKAVEILDAAPQPPAEAHCTTCSCVPGMTPAVRLDTTPAEKEGAVRDHLIRIGWAPPPEAQAQPVAWFPTYGNGKLVRNYGDGSPVPASKTKEEAEQAKRCHLGATGPVIPLYAHPPPSAPVGVEGFE